MARDRSDRTETALLWSGRHLFRHLLALVALVALVTTNNVPVLDVPTFYVCGPVLLTGFVLWFALRAAAREGIFWLARINLVILVVLGTLIAMLLMAASHHDRLCKAQPRGRTCAEVPSPIIRLFDARRPTWNPDIPANP